MLPVAATDVVAIRPDTATSVASCVRSIVTASFTHRLWRRSWVAVLGVLVAALGWWVRPPSDTAIRDRAVRALNNRDADELCRLADPEELRHLNVTPEAVRRGLAEAFGPGHSPPFTRAVEHLRTPMDQSVWMYLPEKGVPDGRKIFVMVIDDQHAGWKLNLTATLWSAFCRRLGSREGTREYYRFARRNGIGGLRHQDGSCQTHEEREAWLRQREAWLRQRRAGGAR